MSNTLKGNAYHILGLDTSASQKEILRRSKEIINRLKIDDLPKYDFDFGLFNNFRTEESVKDAVQRLQSPKKKIKDFFFWFQITDEIDEQAINLLKTKGAGYAIEVWEKASQANSTKSLFYKKNLTILYCLLLSVEDNVNYLNESLAIWKELMDSDKFWIAFSKIYQLQEEQTTSEEIVSEYRKKAVNDLADLYAGLHNTHKQAIYISRFQKIFSVKGEQIEKNVLGPAYRAIHDAVEGLEKLKVSADGLLDKQEKKAIKNLIELIRAELNNLINLGLYNDSQTRVMRDRAASALRSLSIELHNNLDEIEIALGLAKIAEEISGMESSKSKIQADIETLQGNLEYKVKKDRSNKIVEPIIQKIKSGKFEKALREINHLLYSNDTDVELKEILQELKQTMEERIAKHGKPIGSAPSLGTINGIGTKIYGDTLYFVVLFIPVIPIARYSLEDHGNGSYTFFGKLELHKRQKYWQYILIGLVVIWILIAIFNG